VKAVQQISFSSEKFIEWLFYMTSTKINVRANKAIKYGSIITKNIGGSVYGYQNK